MFGGIDHVGGETDLATSAGDVLPAQPNTGARNESSVLFSLSALTAGDVSPKPRPQTSGDDSGLIDLAALAAQADRSKSSDTSVSAMPVPLTPPLGAPLYGGSTAPLGNDGAAGPSVPNRNGLYIGGGIAVAAMVLGGVFLLREPPPPALQPIAIPTALPSAPAEVAAPEEDDELADAKKAADEDDGEEQADEDDSAEEKKVATTTKKTYRRTSKPKTTSTTKKTASSDKSSSSSKSSAKKSTASETKKPAAKKRNNCNCKSGDLMCAMKCSAK